MVSRVEAAHAKSFLHRDIKPDNFVLGIGTSEPGGFGSIYLLDFGLSKRFTEANGAHIPLRSNKQLTGTARFVSLRTHEGEEQSRRDDLEALVYVLAYFVRGSLPWMGLRGATTKAEKYAVRERRRRRRRRGAPPLHRAPTRPHQLPLIPHPSSPPAHPREKGGGERRGPLLRVARGAAAPPPPRARPAL